MQTDPIKTFIATAKFDWVSDYAKMFTYEEPREGDIKIFEFDRYITSEEAIAEMQKDGYEPANSGELLEYAKDGWNGTDFCSGLGTIWQDPLGDRQVLVLGFSGGERGLDCSWFDGGWYRDYRFVARRPRKSSQSSNTQPSALGNLELERAIELVKEAGYQVAKII